jgi:UDP-N-acetylglucosamine--N-acetylmuramyl-(pentapeptide) pyrophosphoryl-undecaprenol N-acetylglucosamine transferase
LIVVAGGGSGGHISPGLAIVERLRERWNGSVNRNGVNGAHEHGPSANGCRPESEPRGAVFVCSQRTIDTRMLSSAGARYVPIPAVPPSTHPLRAMKFLRAFRTSKQVCRQLMRSGEVAHLLALGGFVAAPAVAAARSRGIPVTLLNLDDPPGRANRWIARGCDRIWTATKLRNDFAERVVGMPIRRRAIAPATPPECRAELGLDPDRPTLLVTGASQGAVSINQLMIALADDRPEVFRDWQIYHLSGFGSVSAVRSAYARRGIRARVEPFLDDIGLAWGAADVAFSRSGANSVAEAAANALPTLFLPYPHHRDMHQRHNAQPLVDLGGALMEQDRVEARENLRHAGAALARLLSQAAIREDMRRVLEEHRPPDAASHIADLLLG